MEELEQLSPYFSKCNRTRCFLHVLNLVAKSMLKAFDLPDKGADNLDNDELDLLHLAEGIDSEEETTQRTREMDLQSDETLDDDSDGWIDQIQLSKAEESNVKKARLPVTRVLVKVCE